MFVAPYFTITSGDAPSTLVVQGTVGRYSDMRTVWLEERPGRFVALDRTGSPIVDPYNPEQRVTVDWDGTRGWMGMYTVSATRFAGNTRDEALTAATVELHD